MRMQGRTLYGVAIGARDRFNRLVMGDRSSSSGLRSLRWYAIAAPLVAALALDDATGLADPLDEPWRIARADPTARLRSADLSVRRGGAYALLRSRLTDSPGVSETERFAQDEALLSFLTREADLEARLTALTALALPVGRDPSLLGARIDSLNLSNAAPPIALASLHAFGLTALLRQGAGQEAFVVPDDDRAAVSLDALARRPDVSLEGHPLDEPLSWRILARRGDPSAAAAIVAELTRAPQQNRRIHRASAVWAARSLRLVEAVPALVAMARGAPERELRRQATAALGDLGGVATEDLVALIDDPLTRASALGAVARLGHREALPAVRRYLQDTDPGDRAAAVDALAALEGRVTVRPTGPSVGLLVGESVAALERRLLTDVDGEVRVTAAMALARRRGVNALRAIEAATVVAWSAAMLDGLSLAAAIARDPTLAAEP